jgi:hypothetical protein
MQEERLTLNIDADDSASRPALGRVNSALSTIEQGAKKAATAAEGAFDSLAKGMLKFAEASIGVHAVTTAFQSLLVSVTSATTGVASHGTVVDGLVNIYRAARVALSPTLFTGITIAAGIAAEQIARLTIQQSRLIDQQARIAANSKIPISASSAATIGVAGGEDNLASYLGLYNKLFDEDKTLKSSVTKSLGLPKHPLIDPSSSDLLRDVAAQLSAIQDPADRARAAFKIFGDDADKALSLLNDRFVQSTDRANAWGLTLSSDTRQGLIQLKQSLDELNHPFQRFKDDLEGMITKAKLFAVTVGTNVAGGVLAFAQGAREGAQAHSTGDLSPNQDTTDYLSLAFEQAGSDDKAQLRNFLNQSKITKQLEDAREKGTEGILGGDSNDLLAKAQQQFRSVDPSSLLGMVRDPKLTSTREGFKTLNSSLDDVKRQGEAARGKLADLQRLMTTIVPTDDGKGVQTRFEQLTDAQKFSVVEQAQGLRGQIKGIQSITDQAELSISRSKAIAADRAEQNRAVDDLLDRAHGYTGSAGVVAQTRQFIRDQTTRRDEGGEYQVQLSADNRLKVEKALQLQIQAEQKKTIDLYFQEQQQALQREEGLWQREFEERNAYNQQTEAIAAATAERALEYQQTQLQQSKDLQLAQLDTVNAKTVQQKIGVEQKKLAVEVNFLQQSEQLEIEKQQRAAESDLWIQLETLAAKYTNEAQYADQYAARADAINAQLQQSRDEAIESSTNQIQTAQLQQQTRASQLIQDHTKQVYDTIKQEAGGVFDALLTKSSNVFEAIGNIFKTAILTAIKDVVSSSIAATFTKLITGRSVSGGTSGGLGGILGLFAGGAGAGPVQTTGSAYGAGADSSLYDFGGGNVISLSSLGLGPGGTAGVTGPVSIGTGSGSSGGLGSLSGIGSRLGGGSALSTGIMTAGGVMLLSGIGKTNTSGTINTIAGGGMLGYGIGSKLGGQLGGVVGAEAGIGAGIFANGVARKGAAGLGETVGGGALAGAAIGSIVPGIGTVVGAAIGAGVGLVAGIIGLFQQSAEDKAKKHIKDSYGIKISDSLATQIVQIAKDSYGSNIDLAISSAQVRQMLQLYAMATGQNFGGVAVTPQAYTLEQTGGTVYNLPSLLDNQSGGQYGGALTTLAATSTGSTAAATAKFTVQLDGQATASLLQGQAVQAIGTSAGTKAVASAAQTNNAQNNGRRQTYVAQAAPGLVTA